MQRYQAMLLERARGAPEDGLLDGRDGAGPGSRVSIGAGPARVAGRGAPGSVPALLQSRVHAVEQERILVRLGQDIPFRPNDGVSTKPGELHAPTVAVQIGRARVGKESISRW